MIIQINRDRKGKGASVRLIAQDDEDRKSLVILSDAMMKPRQGRLHLDHHVTTPKGVENLLLATGK